MNLKVVVAILLVVAVPVYAHAQNLRVGDAQKVVTIKTQTYCEIMKLGEQVGQAHEKNDRKIIDELSQKIDTLEKILGPEYVALINGVQEIRENDQLRAEFFRHLEHSLGCVRDKSQKPERASGNSRYYC
jgi:wobble nucleotide-excising tRNase